MNIPQEITTTGEPSFMMTFGNQTAWGKTFTNSTISKSTAHGSVVDRTYDHVVIGTQEIEKCGCIHTVYVAGKCMNCLFRTIDILKDQNKQLLTIFIQSILDEHFPNVLSQIILEYNT